MPREDRVSESHILVKLFGCELRYPEYGLAFLAMWWGVWELLFVDFAGQEAYRYMASLAPSYVWGAILIALGVWLLIGLHRNHRPTRCHALQALTVYWVFVLATIGLPNWTLTALPTYVAIIGFHVAAYLRLSGVITLN